MKQTAHSKFLVKNKEGQILVAVEKGEVNIKGEGIEKNLTAGRKVFSFTGKGK